ncbi:extracellular solute-binding protein [Paenibacillus tritici]|uniref:extracellular solute-binding protein n=1 Tax=Paenibacillus tritici TaxID=1873425 RepID=UPI001BAB7C85|nr:extracellular solute-binding protein [Paenibacillus tritici]QUL53839.1 extracellular solute-binding protein [Paenibacillus tritici]
MYRHNKITPAFVSLLLLGTVSLSACSNSNNGSTGNTAEPTAAAAAAASQTADGDKYSSLPKEISASIYDRGQVAASEGSYEDNRWTKYINENSGVKVNWMPIPRNQEADKFNVLIASEQAPDMMTTYNRDFIVRWANEGVIQPLDEYIDKYSTSYKKYLEEHPELKPYLTLEDGKTYAIASLRPTRANTALFIRQDWLDKLGLKMPKTVDELVEVAKAFRDNDPDGNGQKDTIPMAMSTAYTAITDDWYMARSAAWFVEDGKLVQSFFTDRYKDALAFRQLAYKENLVDKEFATDKEFSRQKQLWTTGRSGIYFSNLNMDNTISDLRKNNPGAKLTAVPPLATKYGTNGYEIEVPNHLLTAFNKDMKNPKAAMELIDWMLDTGWEPLTYGDEGVHYQMKNNIPVTTDYDKWKTEVGYAAEYRVVQQEQYTPDYLLTRAGDNQDDLDIAKLKNAIIKFSETYTFRKDIPYIPPVAEYSSIAGQFETKWKEINTRMAMGSQTPDEAVEELRKAWNSLDGDSVTAKVQAWYDTNKDKLK